MTIELENEYGEKVKATVTQSAGLTPWEVQINGQTYVKSAWDGKFYPA